MYYGHHMMDREKDFTPNGLKIYFIIYRKSKLQEDRSGNNKKNI